FVFIQHRVRDLRWADADCGVADAEVERGCAATVCGCPVRGRCARGIGDARRALTMRTQRKGSATDCAWTGEQIYREAVVSRMGTPDPPPANAQRHRQPAHGTTRRTR